jgi:hypothetical protein
MRTATASEGGCAEALAREVGMEDDSVPGGDNDGCRRPESLAARREIKRRRRQRPCRSATLP